MKPKPPPALLVNAQQVLTATKEEFHSCIIYATIQEALRETLSAGINIAKKELDRRLDEAEDDTQLTPELRAIAKQMRDVNGDACADLLALIGQPQSLGTLWYFLMRAVAGDLSTQIAAISLTQKWAFATHPKYQAGRDVIAMKVGQRK